MINNTTQNRKNIFYTAMLILTLIITIIGTVYAFTMLMDTQKEGRSTIYTGTLSIDYITGSKIECSLVPIYTPASVHDENAYTNTFVLRNTGSLNATVNIFLEISLNEFSSGALKFALYDSNEKIINTGNISDSQILMLSEDILLNAGEENEYTLQIWLDETNKYQNKEMKKKFLASINFDSVQEKD